MLLETAHGTPRAPTCVSRILRLLNSLRAWLIFFVQEADYMLSSMEAWKTPASRDAYDALLQAHTSRPFPKWAKVDAMMQVGSRARVRVTRDA